MATLGAGEQPDVVPLAFEFDGEHFWVGGTGAAVAATRKFRNIGDGRRKVALMVDDLVSLQPFIARAIRVYGEADDPVERTGLVGRGCTRGSPRGFRGAGTWRASPWGRRGASRGGWFMGS